MPTPTMTHERVDDVPILMDLLHRRLQLDQALDVQVPRHGNWLGLSVGQVMVTWLIHLLSQGDHFMSHVRDWAQAHPETLQQLWGQPLRDTDCTDDRLAEVLRFLSRDSVWHAVETQVNHRMVRVYRLPTERIRLDSTTARIDSHQPVSVLFKRGYSKDHRPDLPQLKLMLAALDPLGALVAVEVVSGNTADTELYVPMVDRVLAMDLVSQPVLFVGDCKMAVLATRAHIVDHQHTYLMPLAQSGQVPEHLAGWIRQATTGQVRLTYLREADGRRWGKGYELTRTQVAERAPTHTVRWEERVLVVRSEAYAATARRGLHQRLQQAEDALRRLTPPRRQGRRQFTEQAPLRQAIQKLLARYAVAEFLTVTVQCEREPMLERPRYVVQVQRNTVRLRHHERTLGWRAYVTNASADHLSLTTALQVYRDEWLIERDCARLKGRPLSIAPLWVSRDDHAIGLTRLLTLAARVLALVEGQVRQTLKVQRAHLTGLYPGQPTRTTDRPTTEALLKVFDQIALVRVQTGTEIHRYLTPLTALQKQILRLLKCSPRIYQRLLRESG